MALPINVKTLLTGNVIEWARIEYKPSWRPEASLKTICAFANDIDNWGGGYLVIGVEDDNGRPRLPVKGVPIEKVDEIMKDLLNKCKLIQPDYLPVAAPVEYEGRMLIVVWVAGGYGRPYSSPTSFEYKSGKAIHSKERTYYIRKMSSTIKPSEDELKDLFSLSNKTPFDDQSNQFAELSDLNVTLVKNYLREVGSALADEVETKDFREICLAMGISTHLPEYQKPRNVGLMFFNFEPHKFFPYAHIDVVEFLDGDGGSEFDENIFKGPLDQQLRGALLYIRNSVIKERVIKQPGRAEADRFFNYPYEAIEEALAKGFVS